MFTQPEIRLLKNTCLKIIRQSDDFIELQSMQTGHCWIIKKIQSRRKIVLHHKHSLDAKYYHKQSEFITVKQAIDEIKDHDIYILNN